MTKEEALRIAAEAASELVLHDLPKRLHEAGVHKIWLNALIKSTNPLVEEGIVNYLVEYVVSS